MKTKTTISSEILQSFNAKLLSIPIPKFCDDSDTLYGVYQYIKRKLQKKTYRCHIKDAKFLKLEEEFLNLYASILEKEEKFKTETGESFQRPFDYFRYTGRNFKRVFEKVRFRR